MSAPENSGPAFNTRQNPGSAEETAAASNNKLPDTSPASNDSISASESTEHSSSPSPAHSPSISPPPPIPTNDELPIEMDNLTPPPFSGLPTEISSDWWTQLENYVKFKKLTNEQTLGLFPLLMKDSAAQWYQKLPGGQKDTVAHLKEAFTAGFKASQNTLWARERAIFGVQQGPSQTVQNYILNVQQAAAGLDIDDEQLLRIVTGGLKPAIRAFVLQRDPQSMQTLQEVATLAETVHMEADSNQSILQELQHLREEMKALALPAVRQARTPSPARPVPNRRVRFQDQAHQPRIQRNHPPRFTPAPWYSQYGQPRQKHFYPQPVFPHPPMAPAAPFRGHQMPPRDMGACNRCGKSANHPRCPAANAVCHFCHKQGHFQVVCRSAKKFFQNK